MGSFNSFYDIQKKEDNSDGTVTVWGVASSEEKDSDGEIIKSEAIKGALPEYFKYGTGALNEMHRKDSAAGVVNSVDIDPISKQSYIEALVVDTEAVKKVKTGVYKGFSIEGSVKKRNETDKSIIDEIYLSKIALVDRPSNPISVFEMFKAEKIETQKESELIKEGKRGTVDIEKDMYSINEFGQALKNMSYVLMDANYSMSDSKLPKKIKKWIEEGAMLYKAFSDEELKQFTASLPEPTKKSETITGEELMLKDEDKKELTELIKSAVKEEMSALKEEKEELDKAEKAEVEPLEKIQKLESVKEALEKSVKEMEDKISKLEKEPEAPKAAVMAVSKEADVVKSEKKEMAKVTDYNGKEDDVASLVKMAHQNPISLQNLYKGDR